MRSPIMRFFNDNSSSLKLPHDQFLSSKRGFSLIEVVIAVGIVGFALISVLGVLKTGLSVFRGSMNTSVGSQIAQHVFDDMQVADFNTLANTNRFFDEQGTELTNSNALTCIYWVQVSITTNSLGSNATTLLGNPTVNLATVKVLIANNPSHLAASNVFASTNPNTITFTTLLGRNK